MKIKLLVIILLVMPAVLKASDCELTDEYRELRGEFSTYYLSAYRDCVRSASDYDYWKLVAECEELDEGKGIGGGCQHLAGRRAALLTEKSDFSHCEKIPNTGDELRERWEVYVSEMNISKCRED